MSIVGTSAMGLPVGVTVGDGVAVIVSTKEVAEVDTVSESDAGSDAGLDATSVLEVSVGVPSEEPVADSPGWLVTNPKVVESVGLDEDPIPESVAGGSIGEGVISSLGRVSTEVALVGVVSAEVASGDALSIAEGVTPPFELDKENEVSVDSSSDETVSVDVASSVGVSVG